MEVTITIEITDEQINDLFVTALEGGSNYWYYIPRETRDIIKEHSDKEFFSERFADVVLNDKYVIPVRDTEEPDEVLGFVDKESVQEALNLMVKDHTKHIEMINEGNYDAETADIFLQLCVMGEITFG